MRGGVGVWFHPIFSTHFIPLDARRGSARSRTTRTHHAWRGCLPSCNQYTTAVPGQEDDAVVRGLVVRIDLASTAMGERRGVSEDAFEAITMMPSSRIFSMTSPPIRSTWSERRPMPRDNRSSMTRLQTRARVVNTCCRNGTRGAASFRCSSSIGNRRWARDERQA